MLGGDSLNPWVSHRVLHVWQQPNFLLVGVSNLDLPLRPLVWWHEEPKMIRGCSISILFLTNLFPSRNTPPGTLELSNAARSKFFVSIIREDLLLLLLLFPNPFILIMREIALNISCKFNTYISFYKTSPWPCSLVYQLLPSFKNAKKFLLIISLFSDIKFSEEVL